jgi:hypothetical protein
MKKYSLLFISFVVTNILFAQWSSDPTTGKLIANAVTSENYQVSVTDGSSGSIVVFESGNGTVISNLYAQRINSSGQLQWGGSNNPKPVCVHGAEKNIENVITDGSGGIYILWLDYREGTPESDIYLQHFNSSGNPLYATNGIKVNSNTDRDAGEARMCTDGGTGVVVVWGEIVYDDNLLLTTYAQLFAQKYNSTGVAQWNADGVEICTTQSLRAGASVVPDGNGGAIISFADARNSNQSEDDVFDNIDIYAQRINNSGAVLWTSDGKPVNTAPFNQHIGGEHIQTNASIPDGIGGVIILFDDYTGNNDGNSNFYAQRLNAAGTLLWPSAGVPVCSSGGVKILMGVLPDGAAGLVSFWSEDRTASSVYDLYAQRIAANGTANWTANGIKLVNELGGNIGYGNGVAADGNGNYIFTWTDMNNQLKAQKINNTGTIQWGTQNKNVCTNIGAYPVSPAIVRSDLGSSIITWLDNRNFTTSSTDIYAAKIDSYGYLTLSNAYITTANGNWNVGSTWLGGIVPPGNADVRVRHTVSVTANASCNSVRVETPAGNLTINTGVSLNVLQ